MRRVAAILLLLFLSTTAQSLVAHSSLQLEGDWALLPPMIPAAILSWSSDGSYIAVGGGSKVVVFNNRGFILWSKLVKDKVDHIEWSPKEKVLLVLTRKHPYNPDNYALMLLDSNGSLIWSTSIQAGSYRGSLVADWSSTGLLAFINGSKVFLVNSNGSIINILEIPGSKGTPLGVQWSPDGFLLMVLTTHNIILYDKNLNIMTNTKLSYICCAWWMNRTHILVYTLDKRLTLFDDNGSIYWSINVSGATMQPKKALVIGDFIVVLDMYGKLGIIGENGNFSLIGSSVEDVSFNGAFGLLAIVYDNGSVNVYDDSFRLLWKRIFRAQFIGVSERYSLAWFEDKLLVGLAAGSSGIFISGGFAVLDRYGNIIINFLDSNFSVVKTPAYGLCLQAVRGRVLLDRFGLQAVDIRSGNVTPLLTRLYGDDYSFSLVASNCDCDPYTGRLVCTARGAVNGSARLALIWLDEEYRLAGFNIIRDRGYAVVPTLSPSGDRIVVWGGTLGNIYSVPVNASVRIVYSNGTVVERWEYVNVSVRDGGFFLYSKNGSLLTSIPRITEFALSVDSDFTDKYFPYNARIDDVKWSPDGSMFAVKIRYSIYGNYKIIKNYRNGTFDYNIGYYGPAKTLLLVYDRNGTLLFEKMYENRFDEFDNRKINIDWSPDGTFLLLTSANQAVIFDRSGNAVTIHRNITPLYAAWSPRGDSIAYVSTNIFEANYTEYIEVRSFNGTTLWRYKAVRVRALTWSPDGTKLAALIEKNNLTLLAIWSWDGELLANITIPTLFYAYPRIIVKTDCWHQIVWLPDRIILAVPSTGVMSYKIVAESIQTEEPHVVDWGEPLAIYIEQQPAIVIGVPAPRNTIPGPVTAEPEENMTGEMFQTLEPGTVSGSPVKSGFSKDILALTLIIISLILLYVIYKNRPHTTQQQPKR